MQKCKMQKLKSYFCAACFICLQMTSWISLEGANINNQSSIQTIGSNTSFSSDVATDTKSDVFAVFIHSDGSNQRIQSAVRLRERPWKTIERYLSPAGSDA